MVLRTWPLSKTAIALYYDFLDIIKRGQEQNEMSVAEFIKVTLLCSADERNRIIENSRVANQITYELPSHQGVFRFMIKALAPVN